VLRRPVRLLLCLVAVALLAAPGRGVSVVGAQERLASDAAIETPSDWHAHIVRLERTRFDGLAPLPPVETLDARFGVVEAFRLSDRDLTRRLGVRHERIAFWWSGLQSAPGAALNPFYFASALLERERRQGIQVTGLLLSTPAWAAANPADGPHAIPRNLGLPWDHPDNYWGRFAQLIARDHAGQIDDWIVWNEPDIQPTDPNAAYHTWAGSVADYYDLLRVAYRAIKVGNPRARVHLAGLTYWADREANRPQYFERLLDLIAADPSAPEHSHYFDVASLHLYTDPHGLYQVPRLYRELMRARGMDKPIWINETNIIPWDDPANQGTGYDRAAGRRCTLADQTSFPLQPSADAGLEDAELVALGVGEHDPGLLALADVHAAGAQADEALHLLRLVAAHRVHVKV
jgi:hypothetical protein